MTDGTANDRKVAIVLAVLLVLLTFVVFQGVLGHQFLQTDDQSYIVGNPHVTAGLTLRGIAWAFTTGAESNWHPLTWISHMLDCSLYGTNPAGHHATNLLFHIANALLLFFLLRRMTACTWRSAFVAALFAVHPLHVESVAWAAERKDVLSAFFWLLTTWAYVRYVERPSTAKYALVLLSFVLGLLSKPVLVTLPFTLLLLDYWPLGRVPKHPWSSLIWEKSPLFVLAMASGAITYIVQQRGGAMSSLSGLSFGIRAANAVVAYASYIGKMLWPHDLAILYPHPTDTLPQWQVVGSALMLVLLTTAALRARKHRYLAVGWLWYVGTLVPMIGLIQVGAQSMADRYTYIPFIGLFVIVAWGVGEWGKWARAKAIVACVVIIALGIAARAQVGYWKDSYTVFTHANQVTRDNYLADTGLGNVMAERGRLDEAVRYYSKALELCPDAQQTHLGLGLVLVRQGKLDEAISHFRASIAARPDFAAGHFALARALAEKGSLQEASESFAEAARLNPDNVKAFRGLGDVLLKLRRFDDAADAYQAVLKLDPNDPTANYNVAIAFASHGDFNGAISHLSKALVIKPDYGRARERLAQAYYFTGNYRSAWEQVRLCEKYHYRPDPRFIQALRRKMPE